jgi:TIR domain
LQPQGSTVYIYLSAPGDDFETERRLFVDVVLTELRTRASAVGISLVAILPEEWPPGDRGLGRRLREIRDNRPLFVAFLGERAGQTEAIPDDFLADFTWLQQWHDSTAREIEIFFAHGVLEKRCFVYRRNADFIDEVPPEARDSYVPADAADAARVAVLSDQVRAKQYRFNWTHRKNPDAALPGLAERVINDLWRAIDPTPPRESPVDYGTSVGTGIVTAECDGDVVTSYTSQDQALPFHEDVQFTVYRPRVARPAEWTPILAFAHLGQAPVDSADDPVLQVERRAKAVLGDRMDSYSPLTQDSSVGLPEDAEVTFVLDLPGFDVRAPRRTFLWINDVHMEEFQVRPGGPLNGRTARGSLLVYHGSILLAEVRLAIQVDARVPVVVADAPVYARPFRRIFPSYSHRDASIVEEFEAYAAATGDSYLRDVRTLRSGEVWNERLLDFINAADVFQLFWSHNAMKSRYVEQEWRYALSLGRPNFVRPTYWEQPMPQAPGLPPDDLRRIHFHLLGREAARPAVTEAITPPTGYQPKPAPPPSYGAPPPPAQPAPPQYPASRPPAYRPPPAAPQQPYWPAPPPQQYGYPPPQQWGPPPGEQWGPPPGQVGSPRGSSGHRRVWPWILLAAVVAIAIVALLIVLR